ncbi:hypothetical protein QVH35_01285 [Candidatus Nitrosotenuis chungbukensis]|uniref:hypothetical protein n=1 Tax=Candidatus Nitrosotenuis chungbukensis TaxID=1353246 RepID=UPI002671AC13|nr:hypothetical protein [Candidatus Nitrosotenuis chungbukensis]WKT58173.1 hypothetical protein QVH35_01285 [Candidatus Nitrosotenuis chungbukensis]
MKQTERNLKHMLSKLPDNSFRMLAEGIEISPFPILINKEYKKRFGGVDIRLKNSLKKQIRAKQVEQKKLLRNMYVEIKKLNSNQFPYLAWSSSRKSRLPRFIADKNTW